MTTRSSLDLAWLANTEWAQIASLYGSLMRMSLSPVVELNLAVAVAMRDGPATGLAMIDGLAAAGTLDGSSTRRGPTCSGGWSAGRRRRWPIDEPWSSPPTAPSECS